MSQLKMICKLESPEKYIPVAPEGYRIRALNGEDVEGYNAMRVSVEFGAWRKEEDMISYEENVTLPGGHLVLERLSDGLLCASASAEKPNYPEFPRAGNMGWVMTLKEMQGHRFGKVICSAAMKMLAEQGFTYATLQTDDFRVPAVKTYLNLGWRPWIYDETMEARWRAMYQIYGMDYDASVKYPADFKFQ